MISRTVTLIYDVASFLLNSVSPVGLGILDHLGVGI